MRYERRWASDSRSVHCPWGSSATVEGTVSTYPVQTEDCVTRLVLNPTRMEDLRIGAMCLDEVIKNQVQAIEDEERAKRQEIANKKAAVTKVRSKIRTSLWEKNPHSHF